MPSPTLYLWIGDPRKAIPAGFELSDLDGVVEGQPHKTLHVFTDEGEPDLFGWEVWEGETAPTEDHAVA